MDGSTRYEIERAFYRILDNGDEAAIARAMGHSAGYVSQLYSPDNERESTLFKAIRELRAWRRSSMERGNEALALFVWFVEQGLEPETLDIVFETKAMKREVDEWENSEMAAASPELRVEELRDIRIQAERTLKAHEQQSERLRAKARRTIEIRGGRAA